MRAFAVALAACVLAGPAAAALPPLTRVQVTAKEFYFSLSRQTVAAGPAIIQLVNFGEDPHDLRLQRVGGAHIAGTPEVQPGDYYNLHVRLLRGKYMLWCSIANHRALGMQAVLVVR